MPRVLAVLALASVAANVAANPLLLPAGNNFDLNPDTTTTAPEATISPRSPELGAIDPDQLFGRSACANPCGWSGQLCCQSNERCYTDSNDKAQCSQTAGAAAAAGVWSVYTTRIIQTDTETITSIGSTFVPPTGTAGAVAPGASICNYDQLETPCGNICCASSQYCASSGQCVAAGQGSSAAAAAPQGQTTGFAEPVAASAGAANGGQGQGQAAKPTTTVPFSEPVATGVDPNSAGGAAGGAAGGTSSGSGSSGSGSTSGSGSGTDSSGSAQSDTPGLTRNQSNGGGLSGGAIAGIVIGAIAGIILLAALCVCCFIKGLWDVIFGRRKRRENENRVSNYYAAGRPSRVERKRRWGPAAALAGLAALLGFRHHEKNKNRRQQNAAYNDYESDYASYRGGGAGHHYGNRKWKSIFSSPTLTPSRELVQLARSGSPASAPVRGPSHPRLAYG